MKNVNAKVSNTKELSVMDKIKANLATVDWENMYWVQFSNDCIIYWKKWWTECDGFVAKTVQLVVHTIDRVNYVANAFMFGLICALCFFG